MHYNTCTVFYMSQCSECACECGWVRFTSCQNQFDQDSRNSHREKFKVCISKLPWAHSMLEKGHYSPHLFDQVRSLTYCTQGYHCHIFSQSCCPQLHLLCGQHSQITHEEDTCNTMCTIECFAKLASITNVCMCHWCVHSTHMLLADTTATLSTLNHCQ